MEGGGGQSPCWVKLTPEVLGILELPQSKISDSIVEQAAVKLSTITFLDVSDCWNIGSRALRAIGTHCKSLVGLRRVMGFHKRIREDDEAHAIAATMTKLRHLEIRIPCLSTVSVVEILSSCRELEFLDVRGCLNVALDEKFLEERCSSGLKVVVPKTDYHNFDEDDWFNLYWDDIANFGDQTMEGGGGQSPSWVKLTPDVLGILELPQSKISDSIVEQFAVKLSTITFLDVSDCWNIGSRALRAIGTHCKSLVGLRRVMGFHKRIREDDEAHAIAATMTKLRHLEIRIPCLSTISVVEILSSCRELEFVDVRGCLNVALDEKFLEERCSSGLEVLVPKFDYRNFDESDWFEYKCDYDATFG